MAEKSPGLPLIGGLLAGVAASLCCIAPLVLLMLGIGGAWVANLAAMAPLRPYFLGAAVVCVAIAYRRIFSRDLPAPCGEGASCAAPAVRRRDRILFGLVLILVAASLVSPWVAPLFY